MGMIDDQELGPIDAEDANISAPGNKIEIPTMFDRGRSKNRPMGEAVTKPDLPADKPMAITPASPL